MSSVSPVFSTIFKKGKSNAKSTESVIVLLLQAYQVHTVRDQFQ